jgi:UDP-glucose 4-epimerase
VLEDTAAAKGLNYVSLRYFNAARADQKSRIGECHNPESHIILRILKTAKKNQNVVTINGTDYATPDNTCIRDYIHVDDLADVHLQSLDYRLSGSEPGVFNCGYGHGYSIREVIETSKQETGIHFSVHMVPRRPGDPPVLIAYSSYLKKKLNWTAQYDDLECIIKTAWEWEKKQEQPRSAFLRCQLSTGAKR